MNDDELIIAIKERFAEVHLSTPLGVIARRRRTLRARRQIFGVAGATALAGAAALAVAGQVSGNAPSTPSAAPSPTRSTSPLPGATLAAWSVAEHADGTVQVTIRDLQDPDGLQTKLRADGIPANVHFYPSLQDWGWTPGPSSDDQMPPLPASCTQYDASRTPLGYVAPSDADSTVVFTIDPSDIPYGAGVALESAPLGPQEPQVYVAFEALVNANPQCTGS